MNGILSQTCLWIYSICTTGKLSKILHKASNLNKLLPEKQSWLSLIFHIPVDDVPPHSSHCTAALGRSPVFLSGSCHSSPGSLFQPFPGCWCPHSKVLAHITKPPQHPVPWHIPCGSQNAFYDCVVLHFFRKLQSNCTHTNWKAEALWKTVCILL